MSYNLSSFGLSLFLSCSLMFLQVAGAAILGVGIWVKVDSGSIFGLIEKLENAPEEVSQLLNVSYLLIALGSVLLIIGFLGCCGVMRQSKCMLLMVWIYALLLRSKDTCYCICLNKHIFLKREFLSYYEIRGKRIVSKKTILLTF